MQLLTKISDWVAVGSPCGKSLLLTKVMVVAIRVVVVSHVHATQMLWLATS